MSVYPQYPTGIYSHTDRKNSMTANFKSGLNTKRKTKKKPVDLHGHTKLVSVGTCCRVKMYV